MRTFLSLAVLAALAGQVQAVVSTFDVDDEGWMTAHVQIIDGGGVADTPTGVTYYPTGGNPGGYIFSYDQHNWNYFVAPSKFLDDHTYAFGGELSFETYTTQSDGVQYASAVLMGGGLALYRNDAPPGTAWTHLAYRLDSSGGWLRPGGAAATDAEIATVLANVTGLFVQGDWHTGGDEIGLDNVTITPEPVSLIAIGLGFAVLRRRR